MCTVDCRCTTEVAGIGLDASLLRFARQHLQAVYAWPLGGSVVFSLGAWQGPYAGRGHLRTGKQQAWSAVTR